MINPRDGDFNSPPAGGRNLAVDTQELALRRDSSLREVRYLNGRSPAAVTVGFCEWGYRNPPRGYYR